MKRTVRILLSAVAACVLLVIGAWLADRFNLPVFHTWALIHGMAFVLFPIYFVAAYLLLGLEPQQHQPPESASRGRGLFPAVSSVVLSAIGFIVPFLSILGFVLGHVARSRAQPGSPGPARVVAIVGLISGYVGFAYWCYLLLAFTKIPEFSH